jgi:predicted RNase H-like nuclease
MSAYIGVDLAWSSGTQTKPANETGLVSLARDGQITDAGWARGLDDVLAWIVGHVQPGDVIAIDAPLVVPNLTGQRLCERETGSRYMYPWKVAANSSNRAKKDLVGVLLRQQLELHGVRYVDGLAPHDPTVTEMFECYPYTTIVGTDELAYDVRPQYKRSNKRMPAIERAAHRAAECDELLRRMSLLRAAAVPMDLGSHPVTRDLLTSPSPLNGREYKHREDLIDAALAAWTAALWAETPERVQVLGATAELDEAGRRPTIVAPAKAQQRRA